MLKWKSKSCSSWISMWTLTNSKIRTPKKYIQQSEHKVSPWKLCKRCFVRLGALRTSVTPPGIKKRLKQGLGFFTMDRSAASLERRAGKQSRCNPTTKTGGHSSPVYGESSLSSRAVSQPHSSSGLRNRDKQHNVGEPVGQRHHAS